MEPQPEIWQLMPGWGQLEAKGSGWTWGVKRAGCSSLSSIRSPSLEAAS